MSLSSTLPEEFEARVAALASQGIWLADLADSRTWPGCSTWRVVLRHGATSGRGTGQTLSQALRLAEQDLAKTLSLALPSLADLEL